MVSSDGRWPVNMKAFAHACSTLYNKYELMRKMGIRRKVEGSKEKQV